MKPMPIAFLAILLACGPAARAADPWPAEAHTAAIQLTALDSGLNTVNWSGAFWNPATRTLWLACNSGYFWALVEGGPYGIQVATNAAGTPAKWTSSGDFEAICQAGLGDDRVYVMDENGYIREFDVAQFGVVVQSQGWDIRAQCPEAGGASGGEGIAFVPDEFLQRQRFCDSNGVAVVSSNGMGGLMFVGYQNDGFVYAFDLNRGNGQYTFVGRYKTGRTETADLEFDRATGQLYVWHNLGENDLEVVELNSYADGADRRLRQLAEYVGPRTGNLEGFALVPSAATNASGGCILTDDDNLNGEAILWYREFQPDPDTDADGLSDGYELWNFGSTTQTVGSADSDVDSFSNAAEEIAGTDPNDPGSALVQNAATADSEALVLSWPSATGRIYAIHSTDVITNGFTNTVQSHIADSAPLNTATVDVSGLMGLSFYRIAAERP